MLRRSFLKGILLGLGSLLLPKRLFAEPLTEVDRAFVESITDNDYLRRHTPFISKIRVHRLLYQQMNLRSFQGVRIEPSDEGPDQNGYLRYYWVEYNAGLTACGCRRRPEQFEGWLRAVIDRRDSWNLWPRRWTVEGESKVLHR